MNAAAKLESSTVPIRIRHSGDGWLRRVPARLETQLASKRLFGRVDSREGSGGPQDAAHSASGNVESGSGELSIDGSTEASDAVLQSGDVLIRDCDAYGKVVHRSSGDALPSCLVPSELCCLVHLRRLIEPLSSSLLDQPFTYEHQDADACATVTI